MQAKRMAARAALAAVTLTLLLAGAAGAETTPLQAGSDEGILVFASPDEQFKWWLDIRVNLDGTFFVEDKNPLGDGVQIRRARLGLKTVLWRDWYAEIDVDFAEEAVAMKDIYVRYDNLFGRTAYVRAGNFREPFGLEENTTSRYLLFPERSQGLDGFVPGRKMGIEFAHFKPQYRFSAGVFGPDVTDFETESQDMVWNYTGRAAWNTLRTENSVLHMAVAGSLRQPQFDSGSLRFRTRNEYHVNNYKYVDTDNITHVDRYNQGGIELAGVKGPVRVQGEYCSVGVDRAKEYQDLVFKGGYVCASLFLTGETHPYDWQAAEFGRVVPKHKIGAWELVSRYSMVDMTDHDVLGGESTALSLGLNWYANANMKVYLDYVMVDNDENANAKGALVGDDDFQFFIFRLQAAF